MLGIAGEVGTLLEEYKKHLRDGDAHKLFSDHVAEELGDVLWYLAQICTELDLSLTDVAEANIKKLYSRQKRGTIQGDGDYR